MNNTAARAINQADTLLFEADSDNDETLEIHARLCATIRAMAAEYDALLAFKEYTHKRLDELGVPHEIPDSEHTKAGCRIGGRLDWIAEELAQKRQLMDMFIKEGLEFDEPKGDEK